MSGPSSDRAGSGPAGAGSSRPAAPWEAPGGAVPTAPWETAPGGTETAPATTAGRNAVAAQAVTGAGPGAPAHKGGTRTIAFLLAAVAVAAAAVGFRAASIAGEASGNWQKAVRLEVKRSTSAQETVRYLYNTEVPLAITIMR